METLPRAPIKTQKTFVCNETIIINLIKQDLINWKMIHSLQKMQVRADDYQLDIGSKPSLERSLVENSSPGMIFTKPFSRDP
jgi:hypothetical protein